MFSLIDFSTMSDFASGLEFVVGFTTTSGVDLLLFPSVDEIPNPIDLSLASWLDLLILLHKLSTRFTFLLVVGVDDVEDTAGVFCFLFISNIDSDSISLRFSVLSNSSEEFIALNET